MAESYDSYTGDETSLHQNGGATASNPSLAPAALSSVIRKKLMGYVGFANLPNQVHRKSVRKGFQFTAMVVGESLSTVDDDTSPGVYSFAQANPAWESPPSSTRFSTRLFTLPRNPCLRLLSDQGRLLLRASTLVSTEVAQYLHYSSKRPSLDIEENGVRLHLTVVDTPGFGDFINNDDRCVCVRCILAVRVSQRLLYRVPAGTLFSRTLSLASTLTSSRRTV